MRGAGSKVNTSSLSLPIRPRLLIACEDDGIILPLVEVLQDLAEIFCSNDESETLALVREIRPDMVLIDADMPGKWGVEACAALKEEDGCADMPVLIITARDDLDSQAQGRQAGAVDFITKPINSPVVRKRIKIHLSLKRGSGAHERRLMTVYRALSETSETFAKLRTAPELFAAACQSAIGHGGMSLAWIGVPDSTNRIVPVASNGKAAAYLENLMVMATPDLPEGLGFVGAAFRDNRPMVANNLMKESRAVPWGKKNRAHGVQSIAAFPISRYGKPYAMLTVYNDRVDAFDGEIVFLLEEMAGNISFCLDNFDREEARKKAEEELKLASVVYQDSSEAMMIIDSHNSIIAVNRAFEKITGHQRNDVIGRYPLLLNSDRHDTNFYKSLWKSLNNSGRWNGEIKDKQKKRQAIYRPDHHQYHVQPGRFRAQAGYPLFRYHQEEAV